MYKRWVFRSNGKQHPIDMKIGMDVKNIYKCIPIVGLSKYEFNNKLLGGVTVFRVTWGVTWTQPYIS